ncbi:MAG: PAS domain-containing protein [Bacteroidetes bacterium]|nr:PAS domain-containing protein [Bacteroidota bacterium]
MQYPYSLDSTLSVLIQANLQFIFSTDIFGNINYYNNKSAIQLQLAENQNQTDQKLIQLLNDSDKISYRRTIQKCLEDISQSQTVSLRSFGELNFKYGIQFVVSVISDDTLDPIGFLFIGQELTRTIDQPIALNRFDALPYDDLKTLLGNKQIMIWMLDKNQNCSYVNETIYERFKSSPHQELGKAFLNRFRLNALPETYEAFEQHLNNQKEFSLEINSQTSADQKLWLQIIGIPRVDTNGFFIGFILYGTDISIIHDAASSMKKQTELISILNKEYAKFKKLASISNQGILITNTINQITWMNDAVTNLMGYSLKDVLGKQDFQLFCGTDTSSIDISFIKSSVCDILTLHKEMLLYKKSGQKLWIEFIKEPIYDENNKFCGFFIILNDIQIKKISEKEIAQQILSLKRMSFIASHEIRHEFTKIMQVTQTIKLHEPDIATYQHLLSEIEKSTEKVNKAIFELNDQINFATSNTISLDAFLNQEIEEILLIDDDKLVNEMNLLVIKTVHPDIQVKIFSDVDYALSHIISKPETKRKIFVDLNFPHKSGWYFLDEYKKIGQPWTVVILTSSLQQEDIEYSKQYEFISHYMTKPMNIEQLKELKIQSASRHQLA